MNPDDPASLLLLNEELHSLPPFPVHFFQHYGAVRPAPAQHHSHSNDCPRVESPSHLTPPRRPMPSAATSTTTSSSPPPPPNASHPGRQQPTAPRPTPPTAPKRGYMSIMDYSSSTTTTTTTKFVTRCVDPLAVGTGENEHSNVITPTTGVDELLTVNSNQEDGRHSSQPLLTCRSAILDRYGGTAVGQSVRNNHRPSGASSHLYVPVPSGERSLPPAPDDDRETWGRKIDFLLSVIGFAVDLANVWRFPYLCFKNGGGAFLIPYSIMVIFAGIPLFYMELALGQFHRKGAITTWGRICPLFKGIGYCVIMTAFYTDFFYNVIIAFALHYFYASFTTTLPWTSCSGSYNSPACYEPSWADVSSRECATEPVFINRTSLLNNATESHRPISAAEEYFYKHFLGLHAPGEPTSRVHHSVDNLGSINWEIVLCVGIIYVICYFSLWKGIKMSGKVVWFTAIFPYVVLVVLLIRGVTLPGAARGIAYYLKPNLEMLKVPSVWQDAATQVFFSLGPGFGVLMAYSSYNEFHNNVYFDALLTSTINCCTSFLAGFVIFSVLGYMSCKSGKPIHEVAQEGPGLVFVVYPEALATMPGASIWSLVFFLMLLTLGLDSSFGGSEAIITGLSDEFPLIKRNREVFVAVLFSFYMLVAVLMCTRGGMLIMEWLIVYGTTWGLLVAVFCEAMVISFCYGVDRFSADIHQMLGFTPGWYWRVCWAVGAPIFLLVMIANSVVNYVPLQYQDYEYPTEANVLGVLFALSSVSAIPLVAVYTYWKQDGDNCCEKLQFALTPYSNSTIRKRQSRALSAAGVGIPAGLPFSQSADLIHSSNDIML